MGLRADIQAELTDAMAGDLLDVVVEFTLLSYTQGATYDVVNDTRGDPEVETETQAIFSSYGVEEIDDINIKLKDEKVILNGADLAVEPKVDDVIELEDGTQYVIKNVKNVMGGKSTVIAYIVQARIEG